MADDTSATIWSWLKDVCEAQNFANPGWVTPQDGFERLKGCVPEWILEDEHRFSWKVVSLLGLYGGLSFNLHAPQGLTYLNLCFTGADYSDRREEDQPENWEERLCCGHIYAGAQFTIDLCPGGAVALVSLNHCRQTTVANSFLDFLVSLKCWLDRCLPADREQYKTALRNMKTGPGGPSHASVAVVDVTFVAFHDFLLATAMAEEPKAKKPRDKSSFVCHSCGRKPEEGLRCCVSCGEENDFAHFCHDCCRSGSWCSKCDACFECCNLSHSPDVSAD